MNSACPPISNEQLHGSWPCVGRWPNRGMNENADANASAFFFRREDQNAGSTAPLYFLAMNSFTCGLVRALASFWMASLSLLSGRATVKFTYGESLPSITRASLAGFRPASGRSWC